MSVKEGSVAQLNLRERVLEATIAYFGPELSGRSTNLHKLVEQVDAKERGPLETDGSVLSLAVRPQAVGKVNGCDVRFRVRAAPLNEDVLREVDGVVLVVPSRPEEVAEARNALEALRQELAAVRRPQRIPIVVQLNKRDVPFAMDSASILEALGVAELPHVEATAANGEGVVETFGRAVDEVMEALREHRKPPAKSLPTEVSSSATAKAAPAPTHIAANDDARPAPVPTPVASDEAQPAPIGAAEVPVSPILPPRAPAMSPAAASPASDEGMTREWVEATLQRWSERTVEATRDAVRVQVSELLAEGLKSAGNDARSELTSLSQHFARALQAQREHFGDALAHVRNEIGAVREAVEHLAEPAAATEQALQIIAQTAAEMSERIEAVSQRVEKEAGATRDQTRRAVEPVLTEARAARASFGPLEKRVTQLAEEMNRIVERQEAVRNRLDEIEVHMEPIVERLSKVATRDALRAVGSSVEEGRAVSTPLLAKILEEATAAREALAKLDAELEKRKKSWFG